MKKLATGIIVLLLNAPVSDGAMFSKKSVKLVLVHAKGTVEARTFSDQALDSTTLGSGDVLEVRGNTMVALWVEDPNPLLFSYSWQGLTLTENADYQQALSFAKSINTLVGLIGSPAGTPAARQAVARLLDSAAPPESELGRFRESVAQLIQHVGAIPSLIQASSGDAEAVREVKSRVNGWALSEIEERTDAFYSSVVSASLATLVAPVGSKKPVPTEAERAEAILVEDALRAETKIRAMLEAAKRFAATVQTINVPRKLGDVPYNYRQDTTAKVTIAAVADHAKAAASSGRQTGDFTFLVRAYTPARLTFGAAAVYSFVDAPEFTAEKQTDGTLKVAKKSREYRGLTVSAMLSITPRGWSEPTLGGSIQLGVSPIKDQIGLFVGGALHITDLVNIGGGYAYQQVQRLGPGLDEGATIAATDALKTEPYFKGGFYLSIELHLP